MPDEKKIAISIHALREEGDAEERLGKSADVYFYPRPPRGGRRAVSDDENSRTFISIHALRKEGDYSNGKADSSSE